ncbi:MAG: hypothetical protein H7326_10780 [Bdellovibrionaceae bacterium]|nr:hypothetical protein [Pseudobdellovibrionaceae bacterium]
MKSSQLKNFAMIVLALASLAACAPANNSAQTARVGSGNGGTVGPNGISVAGCHGTVGRIYDASNSTTSFESRMKGLISANASPSYFGTIDGSATSTQTCVGLDGRLSVDSSGKINIAGSSMKMTVYDSYAVTGDAQGTIEEAYVINFTSATSGTLNGKTFTLQFTDSFGTIQFSGDISTGVATGTVQFQNYKHADGATPASGNLGTFSIPTASFAN